MVYSQSALPRLQCDRKHFFTFYLSVYLHGLLELHLENCSQTSTEEPGVLEVLHPQGGTVELPPLRCQPRETQLNTQIYEVGTEDLYCTVLLVVIH